MRTAEASQGPVSGARVWPLSVEAYHALGEAGLIPKATELLYGFVYHKMSKSPLHTLLLMRLLRLLQSALPAGMHLRPEQPLTCGDSEPEPDLALVAGSEDDFARSHPSSAEWVIEVCVSSADFDRSKRRAYAQAGVKECWLVLGTQKQIEVWRQPTNEEFTSRSVYGPGGLLTSASLPGIRVDLDRLFS